MSVHEILTDTVKSGGTIGLRRTKNTPTFIHNKEPDKDPLICNYDPNCERNVSNGVISVEHRRRRHRHRQRHGGIRNNGKNLNSGKNENKKNCKINNGGRSGKYSASEPLPLLQGSSTFVVFLSKNRLQTLATLVHATGGEDRTPHRTQHTRIFFSLRAV